ncbi:MAG: DUF1524 domain-containing protein, partial [Leadbetterella sp.]|nr:DUF1524 domain-containing protein [Leadbetterella sp.]
DNFVGLIGNMLLLDQRTNNVLENKIFTEKQEALLKSSIFIDDVLKSSTKWEVEEINKRTEYLADIAYNKIFKI